MFLTIPFAMATAEEEEKKEEEPLLIYTAQGSHLQKAVCYQWEP